MRCLKLLPLLGLASVLSACGGSMADLEMFIETTKSKHHGRIDSLKMVGLLQQKSQTWGLVRDPDGTIHRVQPGNFAGQNHGRIVTVGENRIDIIELVPDGLSGWVNREAVLAMAEEN